MSDCYFGLDVERDIKYEVGPAKKMMEDKNADKDL